MFAFVLFGNIWLCSICSLPGVTARKLDRFCGNLWSNLLFQRERKRGIYRQLQSLYIQTSLRGPITRNYFAERISTTKFKLSYFTYVVKGLYFYA